VENVALLLSGARRGPAIAEARKWFGRLGLGGLELRRSGELSGGQAQRVALARGLVARRVVALESAVPAATDRPEE
jgi:putative ABC transport system ATP-binding protein